MVTSKFAETICAMQREILCTTTRATGLIWTQMVEFTEMLIMHNPYVPGTTKELMTSALASYLDFVEEKKNISGVVNNASKGIAETVMKSMGICTESDKKGNVDKRVLDLVSQGPKE